LALRLQLVLAGAPAGARHHAPDRPADEADHAEADRDPRPAHPGRVLRQPVDADLDPLARALLDVAEHQQAAAVAAAGRLLLQAGRLDPHARRVLEDELAVEG